MKPKQTLAFVLFAAAAVLLVWWAASGHQIWTTTQRMVEVRDELFGTVTQTWVSDFTPGLELIGPTAVILTGVGFWLMRRGKLSATIE